ncbi:hypothetical protein BD779DRAFT_1790014 [Infundibulicybe gibba]|nr:hypothetical protein BD779DRAFT_1790014 [Infundibulicybe gibba]
MSGKGVTTRSTGRVELAGVEPPARRSWRMDLLVQTGARASENAEGARTTPSVVAITNATNDPPTAVTAPTYFNDAQRQATEGAGRTACPGVLQATNEFTLAALASGPDRLDLSVTAAYDPGGGTLGTRPRPTSTLSPRSRVSYSKPLALANESEGSNMSRGLSTHTRAAQPHHHCLVATHPPASEHLTHPLHPRDPIRHVSRRAQRCREAQWGSVSCKEQKPQAPRRFSPVSCTPSLPTYSAALQAEGASSYQYPLVSRQFLA